MSEIELTKSKATMLLEKWGKLLDASEGNIKPIEKYRDRVSTAVVLENQQKWCMENTVAGGSSGAFGNLTNQSTAIGFNNDFYATGDARLPKVLIPMVRRTFPELITQEIAGVQPMTGPVGLAFALRYRYQSDSLGFDGADGVATTKSTRPTAAPANGLELGYQLLDTRYSGTSSARLSGDGGVDHLSADFYMVAEDQGIAEILSNYELTGRVPQVTISFEKTAVEAGTRRIAARWSTELEQDLKNMNGLDIDNEIVNSMSYEIQAEIDREIIIRMLQTAWAAGSGNGYSKWYAASADARWMGERSRDLYAKITVESGRMAVRNRRGSANFLIATPNVCAALEMLSEFQMMPVTSSVNSQSVGIAKVGSLGGRYQVYRDTRTEAQYQTGKRTAQRLEYVLLGYKGAEFWDTGIVYCPYIPVMVQRTIGPQDFSPRVGLLTRYGVVDNIFGASLYYHLVLVKGLSTAFAQQQTSVYL